MKSTRGKKSSKAHVKSPKKAAARPKAAASNSARRKPRAGKPFASKSSGKTAPKSNKRATAPMKVVAKKRTVEAPKPAAARSPIVDVVLRAMDDMKAVNVTTLDVRGVTDVADAMVIASGNSDRHVRSIAERVVEFAKKAGHRPMGVEGERDGEWVLVDLNDVIVHVMLPRVREFYRLESLWDVTAARREAAEQ
jgi:ribosome-associated protein